MAKAIDSEFYKAFLMLEPTKKNVVLDYVKSLLKSAQKKPALKKFTSIQLDTRGFKFNREEANER